MRTVRKKMSDWMEKRLSGDVFTWREIIRLTVPYVLDSISIFLIMMLTTALISKNGEESVAAVSLVNPIVGLVTCIFSGIGAGGTVVVAQSCGTGDPGVVKRTVAQVIWPTIGYGLLACAPMYAVSKPLIGLLFPSAEPLVMTKAVAYFRGCLLASVPYAVYTAMFSTLRGMGESKKCLALSVFINVMYLLFSILFLNVLALDIRGSVLALGLARVLGALAAIALLFWVSPYVRMTWRDLFAFDGALMKKTLKVSVPLSLEQLFANCGSIVSEVYMVMLGTSALAAHAVANSLLGLLYSPAMAAGSLAVTVVGRCVGARKPDEARRYGRASVVIGIVLMALTALVFYPLLPLLLKLYNPTAETAEIAVSLLWKSLPMMLLFWPVSYVIPYTLRACNDTLFPSAYSLAVMWTVNILLGYALAIPLGLGLEGVWIASWASWIVRAVGYSIRFRRLRIQ